MLRLENVRDLNDGDYDIGSVIEYTSGGVLRVVLVDEKESDIKNGRPGFGGIVIEGPDRDMSVWGYDADIERIR